MTSRAPRSGLKSFAKWMAIGAGAAAVGGVVFWLYNLEMFNAKHEKFRMVVEEVLDAPFAPPGVPDEAWLLDINAGAIADCFERLELGRNGSRLDPRVEEALNERRCVSVPILPAETVCNPIVSQLGISGLRILQTNRTVLTVLLAGTEEQRLAAFHRLQNTANWVPEADWFMSDTAGYVRPYSEMDLQFSNAQCSNYSIIEVSAKLGY